jgi:polyhydroxyalkanoate synthesis regulator phasin
MNEPRTPRSEPGPASSEGGVADSVRTAVERTMWATAGSAATTRERATGLVDEIVRRGRDARDELTRRGQEAGAEISRRGQEAGAELARRGQEATWEMGRRLELLERRLAELENRLGPEAGPEVEGRRTPDPGPEPEAEG